LKVKRHISNLHSGRYNHWWPLVLFSGVKPLNFGHMTD
jgi:hypothetical protein